MNFTLFELILTSLVIFGTHAITRQGKLLEIVSKVTTNKGLNTFGLANTISECPTCMSSLYGLLGYFIICSKVPLIDTYLICLLAAMVVFSIMEFIINRIDSQSKMTDRFSLACYSMALGYILILNNCFDGLVFIIALAGLNSVISKALEAARALVVISDNIEHINYVASKAANFLIDKK